MEFKKRYKHLLVQHHYISGLIAGVCVIFAENITVNNI
ncbi:glycosyltransferase family 8 C-terminal domain-containing protein [Escherichia coli]